MVYGRGEMGFGWKEFFLLGIVGVSECSNPPASGLDIDPTNEILSWPALPGESFIIARLEAMDCDRTLASERLQQALVTSASGSRKCKICDKPMRSGLLGIQLGHYNMGRFMRLSASDRKIAYLDNLHWAKLARLYAIEDYAVTMQEVWEKYNRYSH